MRTTHMILCLIEYISQQKNGQAIFPVHFPAYTQLTIIFLASIIFLAITISHLSSFGIGNGTLQSRS